MDLTENYKKRLKLLAGICSNKNLSENNIVVNNMPYGYQFENVGVPVVFTAKNNQDYMISLYDFGTNYYVIQTTTMGTYIDRKDSYGHQGGYIRQEIVGVLWLYKSDDGIYRSSNTRSNGFRVNDELKRMGIGTAMHEYANKILNIETDISDVASDEAKAFWKNRKEESN